MRDCLFCKIVANEIEAAFVSQEKEWVAFRDISPQAPIHILVAPREHVATTNDLEARHEGLIGRMVRGAAVIAEREGIAAEGYRLVMNCQRGAGQSVFHVHLHLLGGRPMTWPPG